MENLAATNQEKRYVLVLLASMLFCFLLGYTAGCLTMKEDLKQMKNVIERIENSNVEPVAQLDTLDDWTTLQMAIVMTESRFNPKATGKSGDKGIFQQIPVYVDECNRILKMQKSEERYSHEDSFDIGKSIEMFNLMQSYYNPSSDIDKAIYYQNKSEWYRKKVLDNIVFIQRMEEVRKQLKEKS